MFDNLNCVVLTKDLQPYSLVDNRLLRIIDVHRFALLSFYFIVFVRNTFSNLQILSLSVATLLSNLCFPQTFWSDARGDKQYVIHLSFIVRLRLVSFNHHSFIQLVIGKLLYSYRLRCVSSLVASIFFLESVAGASASSSRVFGHGVSAGEALRL